MEIFSFIDRVLDPGFLETTRKRQAVDVMDYQQARQRMLESQIMRRGVSDPLVLAAMGAIEREKFVPAEYADLAYVDCALPIGFGQKTKITG